MSDALVRASEDWTQASEIDLSERISFQANTLSSGTTLPRNSPSLHPVWVLNINDNVRSFTKPVVLRVFRQGDHFFAENEYLDICGCGSVPAEALQEAIDDMVYYFNHYTQLNEEQVVGFGATLRNRYSTLFQ